MQKHSKKFNFNPTFLIILLFGIFTHVYRFSFRNIWIDEITSISYARGELKNVFPLFSYKPVYFLLLKAWIFFFGTAEAAARSLSVILGVASIIIIYKLCKKLLNREVGLLASFFLAISPFHIYISQQARQFALMEFLVLLSMYIYISYITSAKKRWLPLNLFLNLLIVYSHPYGLAVPLLQSLHLFSKQRFKSLRKQWLFLYSILVLIIIVSFITLTPELRNKEWAPQDRDVVFLWKVLGPEWRDIDWMPPVTLGVFGDVIETFSYGGKSYGSREFFRERKYYINSLTAFLFTAFFLVGFLLDWGVYQKYKSFFAFWFFSPLLLAYLISVFIKPILVIRYLNYIVPVFYVVISFAIWKIAGKKGAVLAGIILFITTLLLIPLGEIYYRVNKDADSWRATSNFLKSQIRENDIVVFAPSYLYLPLGYYFYNRHIFFQELGKNYKTTNGYWSKVHLSNENLFVGVYSQDDLALLKAIKFKKVPRNIWLLTKSGFFNREDTNLIKERLPFNAEVGVSKYFRRNKINLYRYECTVKQ